MIWFIIEAPHMSQSELDTVEYLYNKSELLSNFTSLPYVQEINKLGLLSLLSPGMQVTSSLLLVHGILPRNLYEGTRIMALFVFF